MNKLTIAFIFASLVGGILVGLGVNELNSLSSHAPQIAATSTVFNTTGTVIVGQALPTLSTHSVLWIPSSSTAQITCLYAKGDSCVVSMDDITALQSYLPLLKAIRSGNFAISGNNISVPVGNGSSTDLTNVLNYMQREIGK
jgi:hypothetical protein